MARNIVLQGAINIPDRVIGLVGVDNFKSTGVQPKGDTVKSYKEYAEAIAAMRKDFKKVAFSWFNQDLFSKSTSKAIKDRILNDVAHADTTAAVASMEWDHFNEAAKLQQYKKKLYLINSDYQPTDTTGLVTKHIPYLLLTVHGTGHFPMVEAPEEFNKQLERIMADLKRP